MSDLKDPRLLYLKGGLFLAIGILASTILLLGHPGLDVALLLALAVWAFARAYYFAFYVVEHYIDPGAKYAGLWAFVLDLARRARKRPGHREDCGSGP